MPPVLAGMAGTEYNSRVDDAAAHTAFSCHSLPPSFSCRHQHQQAATSTVVLLFSASLSLLFTTLGAISPQPSCFSAKTHITAIAPFSFVVPIQPGAERWSKDKRRGRSREASAYRSAESARSLRVNMQNQQRGEQGTDGRKQVVIVPLHKHLQKEGRGMDGDSTAPGLRVFGLEAEAGQELKTGALITLSARSAATVRKRGVRVASPSPSCAQSQLAQGSDSATTSTASGALYQANDVRCSGLTLAPLQVRGGSSGREGGGGFRQEREKKREGEG
eukprot:2519822-Rhodomonas_salina.1